MLELKQFSELKLNSRTMRQKLWKMKIALHFTKIKLLLFQIHIAKERRKIFVMWKNVRRKANSFVLLGIIMHGLKTRHTYFSC
jgi:hypothetical protein